MARAPSTRKISRRTRARARRPWARPHCSWSVRARPLLLQGLYLPDHVVPADVPLAVRDLREELVTLGGAAHGDERLGLAHARGRVRLVEHEGLLPEVDGLGDAASLLEDLRDHHVVRPVHRIALDDGGEL